MNSSYNLDLGRFFLCFVVDVRFSLKVNLFVPLLCVYVCIVRKGRSRNDLLRVH